jgi:hypothetical protein
MLLLVRKDEENANKDDDNELKAVHVSGLFIQPGKWAVNG